MTISEYLKQNGAVASTPTATQSQSTGKMGSFVAAQNIKPAQTAKDVSTQSALAEKLSIKKAAQTTTPKATQTTTTTPSALSAWEQTHVPASARQSFVEPTTQEVTGGISDWLSKWRERSAATAAQNTAAADALRAQATPEIETPTTGNRATDIARAASEQYLHALDDPKATEMGRFGNIFNAATNNTLAGFLNTIGLVTSQGEANIPEDVASLVGTVAPELTNNAFSQAARDKMQGVSEKAYNSADTLSQQAAENTTMAKDGLGTIGSLLTDAGIAGVQMAGDIGLAALTGGSALAPMGVRAFGMGAQQARQDGANEREQFIYGIGSAAVEMLTEKIASVSTPFKAYGKGTLDDIIEGLIGKLGKTSGGKAVLKALASAVSEGGEEAISDLVNPLLQKLTYNPDALQQYGDKEYWSNMLNDALVGGALGLVGSTGDVINTARTPTVATDTNVPTTPQNTIAPNLPKTTAVESTQTASDVSGIPTLGNAQTQNSLTPALTNTPQSENVEQADAIDENSIKTGNGIISGLKIKYVPNLKAEARNWHTYIEVGDKFFNLDTEGQAGVLAHEVQHTLAQNLYNGDSTLFEAIMNNPAFGVRKEAPNGRIYWEGIFGDVGSNSVDETFTQALVVYNRNPAWMKENHPDAYEFIKSYKEAQNPVQAPTIAQNGNQTQAANLTQSAQYSNVAQSMTHTQGNSVNSETLPVQGINTRQEVETPKTTAKDAVNTTQNKDNSFESRKAAFNERAKAYNELLQGITSRGKATDEEYSTLQTEGDALNAESASLEQEQRVQNNQVSRNFDSPENHIDNRTNENVKNPSVKAFQFDHPQLHGYYVEAAQQLQSEVAKAQMTDGFGTSKGARQNAFFRDKYNGPVRDAVNLGLTKNEILKCCEDIINNNGHENYAAAKRIELILDTMLSDGYTGMSSNSISKNDAYIAAKESIAGAEKEADRRARQDSEVNDFLMATEGALPSGVGAMSNPFSAERKVSEVYSNTLKNTDILDDVQKSQLEARDYEFDSVSEKESVAKAQQRLQVDFDGEVADLSAMQSYTAAEDVDTAMGILGAFAQDGEIKGDFTAMKQWSKDLYSKIHQSAVTLQAMDKYSRTPEGAVIKAQQAVFQAEQKMTTKKENGKTVQTSIGRKISSDIDNVTKIVDALVNGKPTTGMAQTLNKVKLKDVKELVASGTYDVEAIADLVRSKYGIPTLTTADVQKIYEFTKMADEAKTDYDRRKFLNLSARIVADKMPVTFKNKVLAVRRIAMLMNPKTLISRNAGGNLVFGLFEDIKDAPGTAIDILVSAKTGQRTTSYNPFATTKAEFLGAKKGLTEWGKDIKNGVDTSPTSHEMPRSTALKSKVGAGAEKALYNLLGLGDRPFFEAAYAKRIDELKRLGLDYTSDDAVVQATAYALERVFQNNSVLAQKAMELRESLGVLGDIAIPYVQTPANIIDKLIDASPYGFVRAVKKAGTINDSAWSQKQFVDTLARAMTGTGIITLAFFLCRNGLITGGEPDNEDEGLTYQNKISGWQPYSINFGDKSYTYDWANPIGTLLALGADISQSKSAEDTLTAILMAGLKAGINTMFNQSYLEGLSEIFGQDDIAGGLETMLINLPASFTPTAFQQIARLIDPIARDTYDTDPLKRSWNKVIAKIPWASKKLPAKIGANGQEMTNFGGSLGSNILESLLSPGYIGETTTTKVDDEVQRLYAVTGETSVFPDWSEYTSKSDFSLNANGEKYTTTTAEWERYQKTRGTTAYQLISSVLNTAAYRSLSNTEKADLISDINAYSNDQAKRTILKSRGETYSSAWDAEAAISRESGIPVTTYLIYENAVSNFSADKDKNGNSISGSKKSKVVDYISSLNLTDKQKDYLYLAEGYADSGLGDAPWNKD